MRWQKGQSGNPSGRPKVVAEVRDLARQHTAEVIEALARIMRNPKAPAAARVAAASAILDRGYGKPSQHLDVDGQITLEQLVMQSLEQPREAKADDEDAGTVH